jgi:hypothetical protein
MQPECSLPPSRKHVIGICPSKLNSVHPLTPYLLKTHFNIIIPPAQFCGLRILCCSCYILDNLAYNLEMKYNEAHELALKMEQYISPKRWYLPTSLHCVKIQKNSWCLCLSQICFQKCEDPICDTVLVYYCITVLLYCCITVLLYCCITVLLYCCIAVLLYCCIAVLLYYCIAVLLYCCIAVLLYCCIAVLLYCCIAVLLYYCITVLLYYCITVLLYFLLNLVVSSFLAIFVQGTLLAYSQQMHVFLLYACSDFLHLNYLM